MTREIENPSRHGGGGSGVAILARDFPRRAAGGLVEGDQDSLRNADQHRTRIHESAYGDGALATFDRALHDQRRPTVAAVREVDRIEGGFVVVEAKEGVGRDDGLTQ